MDNWKLVSLLFETTQDYKSNLQKLLSLIENTPQNSLIVAPEVCLTGFDYENFKDVNNFAQLAVEAIKEVSQEKIIILSIIETINGEVFNVAKIFYNGEVVHQRAKARLFHFSGEDKYFSEGKDSDIEIVEVAGIKIAILICFELRFKDLWKKCEGADVIATPSWWGVLRSEHFKAFTKTLAIMNQCYVVASDSLNDECSKMSGIISPMGKELRNGNMACLEVPYEQKEIQKMRRYMDVGIAANG